MSAEDVERKEGSYEGMVLCIADNVSEKLRKILASKSIVNGD